MLIIQMVLYLWRNLWRIAYNRNYCWLYCPAIICFLLLLVYVFTFNKVLTKKNIGYGMKSSITLMKSRFFREGTLLFLEVAHPSLMLFWSGCFSQYTVQWVAWDSFTQSFDIQAQWLIMRVSHLDQDATIHTQCSKGIFPTDQPIRTIVFTLYDTLYAIIRGFWSN